MFSKNQMGVYIHWPFCLSKCPYCDFNSHIRGDIDQDIWVAAYIKSLEYHADLLPDKQIVSIFFGGGTPSLMSAKSVADIIDAVQRLWSISNDIEISLEANPTSVEVDKFKSFKQAGVNRISIGVQAFNNDDLKFLGRGHNTDDSIKAIEIASHIFDRYSFDLIYARPKQSLGDWETELSQAIKCANGHLSLYQLTIEQKTPFYKRHNRGEFSIPDDVLGADFYHLTQDIMEDAAMPAYEVSNHANSGQECRHNLIYWHMADYIGVGAGAHGRFMMGGSKYAMADIKSPDAWLKNPRQELEKLSFEDILVEKLMMGLRLQGGLSIKSCIDIIDMSRLKTICNEGWARLDGDNLHLTREGLLRLNVITPYILK